LPPVGCSAVKSGGLKFLLSPYSFLFPKKGLTKMGSSDSSQLLTQLLSTIADIIQVDKACFLEFDEQQELLSCSACVGIAGLRLVTPLGKGMAGWVAEQGTCMVINDIQHAPEILDELTQTLAESSFLATPLHFENKLLGVIVLAGKRDAAAFDLADRQMMLTLIPLVSWAIHNLMATSLAQKAIPQDKELTKQDRLASVGELMAGDAQEIRNPLAGIMTTAETLKENFEPEDSRKEYLERIINEINRMNQFLVRFFAFARPQKPQKTPCNLPQILDRIIDLEDQNIGRHNVSVIKEYQPSLPTINLDANQMQQVFLNLILNSVQAMPDGGELKISVQAGNGQDEDQPPQYIQVDIADTGVGIKPQDIKKIFTPFHTTKPKGVGLGLAVSHQILMEHNGRAWVDSELGKGTTFSIHLPL
jgi:signal transduction histidine kinase